MVYSLTDKLKFDKDPQIKITDDLTVTVKSDAETVLKLMDIVNQKGEVEGALEAVKLLFSEKDRKALFALRLSMADFTTVITCAMQVAVGENPDEELSGE